MSEVRRLPADGGVVHSLEDSDEVLLDETESTSAGSRRVVVRRLLLGLVPLLIAAGAVTVYMHGGRFVSTENAYVKAHIAYVAAEVSGTITDLPVEENDPVKAGTVLFKLQREPFRIAYSRAEAALNQAESDILGDQVAYQRTCDRGGREQRFVGGVELQGDSTH